MSYVYGRRGRRDRLYSSLSCLSRLIIAPFDSPLNVNTFQLLLRSVDESLIKSVCTYLNQAFKHREQYGNV